MKTFHTPVIFCARLKQLTQRKENRKDLVNIHFHCFNRDNLFIDL